MKQIQITIPEQAFEAMKAQAKNMGVTPNLLARLKLVELFFGAGVDADGKVYSVRLRNWREIEAYLKVRGVSLSEIATPALMQHMRRNALTTAQKEEFDSLLKN